MKGFKLNSEKYSVAFRIKEDDYATRLEDFEIMQKLLENKGVSLLLDEEVDEDGCQIFTILLDYDKAKRNAGPKNAVVKDENGKMLRYSDIVEMQKTMKDEEIIKTLNISQATFYRHLKKAKAIKEKFKNSDYDPYF